ncbi:MAG: universal stress protein [Undibacterium sp.]|uniref:universal stress protein n=1 Tax=Undibacterium sp. TaxID=1914977 RepID=UPI00271C7829|nr:universal stress protein [Undibacterium sp.]MDO8653972.1 universal stress protein [Undibacterium sp.]
MFKHILIPTDGSEASRSAIQNCIAFAKEIGAKITGLHVIPEFHIFTYQPEMLEDTRQQFAKDAVTQAKKYLNEIEVAAKEAGVNYDIIYMVSDQPYEVIIKIAEDKKCDLITMASHGRKGLKGFLLGSEAQKVLTHSQIPVLIFR